MMNIHEEIDKNGKTALCLIFIIFLGLLSCTLIISAANGATLEYKMLEVVSIEKKAYKNIEVPKVIADKKTARRIFEKLNIEIDEIDFSKNVVCITTLDINDHDPDDCHIKPHYSKDGKYLFIQHLCRLRPRNKSDKLWVEPDKLWVQVVKISKGRTTGFQEYNYATKKRDTVLQW